jgi:predicted transcriptional regulator of viral defense system
MNHENSYKVLEYWIEECQSKGKYSFSLKELKKLFDKHSEVALKRMLDRLSKKSKVVSVFKGFYIIVPPQYSSKGILPPEMFIDGLMNFLDRRYYIALLSAASFHGSAHQKPQEYFIITDYPVLRTTKKKGLRINYISTRQLPSESLEEKRKTETGYILVSNPILTAIDLIKYEKRIGGLSRASTIISELVESINLSDITHEVIEYATTSTIQRLGYILEEILDQKKLAQKIFTLCEKSNTKFYSIPLKASEKKDKEPTNERWRIIINSEIEVDQ